MRLWLVVAGFLQWTLFAASLPDKRFTCDKDGFFPDNRNCDVYHVCAGKVHFCSNGQKKTFTCKDTLYWSERDQACKPPGEADCKAAIFASALSPTPSPSTLRDSLNRPSAAPAASTSFSSSAVYTSIKCPTDRNGFFPNPYDCSAYHQCYGGTEAVRNCQPGLYYDNSRTICDYPRHVTCEHKCPSPESRMTFVDPESCCRYFECDRGLLVRRSCPYPNLFNVRTKRCENYKDNDCGVRKACTNYCDYDGNSLCELQPSCAHRYDGMYVDIKRPGCQYFYRCQDQRVFNYTRCPNGLRYNQFVGRCDLTSCNKGAVVQNPFYWFLLQQTFIQWLLSRSSSGRLLSFL